jgi:hypothetical protein
MIPLVEKTYALTTVFFCILVSCHPGNGLRFQQFGEVAVDRLNGLYPSTLWFLIMLIDFEPTLGSICQDNHPALPQRLYSIVFMIAIIMGFGTVADFSRWRNCR